MLLLDRLRRCIGRWNRSVVLMWTMGVKQWVNDSIPLNASVAIDGQRRLGNEAALRKC